MSEASLPLIIAPMGHIERLTHEAQTHPQLQQAAAQQAAAESLRHDRSQVQKTNKSEGGKINPDAEKKKENPDQDSPTPQEAKDGNHKETHKSNPWSGNLLNVKI
jgi:hypothetical protein